MYTYISVYPLSISAVIFCIQGDQSTEWTESLSSRGTSRGGCGGSLPMNSAGNREASQGPLFSYTICKVDGATLKRWRFERGYDRPRLMGVASHRSFPGGIFIVLPINAGKYVLLTWIVIHVGNSPEGYWSSTLQIELLKLGTKTYCWWFRNPTENNHLGYIKLCISWGGISTTVPSTLDRRIPEPSAVGKYIKNPNKLRKAGPGVRWKLHDMEVWGEWGGDSSPMKSWEVFPPKKCRSGWDFAGYHGIFRGNNPSNKNGTFFFPCTQARHFFLMRF